MLQNSKYGYPQLARYKIGFVVLGIFVFGIIIFLIVQASGSRQDAKTQKAAQAIATKLNDYTNKEDTLPENLQEVGVSDVPSTISYRKISDKQYEFCTTYRQDSSNVDASSIFTQALYGYYGVSPFENYDYTNDTILIISSDYKKGKKCQTIEPYTYGFGSDDDSSGPSFTPSGTRSPYFACNESYDSYEDFQLIQSIDGNGTLTTEDKFNATINAYTINSKTKVFNENCTELTVDDLMADQEVTVYITDGAASTIVRF